VLVFVVGVAGGAARLLDVLADHRRRCVIGHAPLARTIIVQDVTKPKLALLHQRSRNVPLAGNELRKVTYLSRACRRRPAIAAIPQTSVHRAWRSRLGRAFGLHRHARRHARDDIRAKCVAGGAATPRRRAIRTRAFRDQLANERADDLVRAAERHAAADEIVRNVGREQQPDAAARRVSIERQPADHRRTTASDPQRIFGAENRLLVLLQILVVAGRQPLDRRQHRDQVTDRRARLAAHQLERIGFFFCGIMLLPVLSASDSSKNRCSSPQKMIRSSASRLRCTIVIAQA
jgi:hypothetical protein